MAQRQLRLHIRRVLAKYIVVPLLLPHLMFAVSSRSAAAESPAGAPAGASSPEAGSALESSSPLEQVVVTGKVIFTQNDAFGATKMGLALQDTPQTITVVTGDMIDFAAMRSFNDYYKVDASGGTSHAIDSFPRNYYRGFRQQGDNAIRIDGFRMPGDIDLDLATFERFEVIKGPTSTLYGQNSIGGTLNAVSKLPQKKAGGELSVEAAQYEEYRGELDVTGPLFGGEIWSYRMIAAYEDDGSFIDFANEKRKLLAPSLQYQPSAATKLILRLNYQQIDARYHFAHALQLAGNGSGTTLERVLSEGQRIIDVPRSRFQGMPWNAAAKEAKFAQFQGEHEFANDWTLRGHAQYSVIDADTDAFTPEGPFDENGFADYGSVYAEVSEQSTYGAEVNLFGDVELFDRRHTLFLGLDFNRRHGREDEGFTELFADYASSLFNVLHPDYTAIPIHRRIDDYTTFTNTRTDVDLFGATVQLIARPADRLSLLLGARYSSDQLRLRRRAGLTGTADEQNPFEIVGDEKFDEVTAQAGVTYEIMDRYNVYASYGQTFEPGTDVAFAGENVAGRLIDPEEGAAYEIGLKGSVTADLFFTAALFDMERTNISQPDREHPGFSEALGVQRSRGVEVGLQGRVLPQLSVFASVAYLDAQFTRGEFKGLQPANAPKFGLSVFGSYEVLEGKLAGLGFGLGVVHKRGRETFDGDWTRDAQRPVTFDFGSFTEVDGRVFYDRGRWRFALEVTNLFDEKYHSPARTELDLGIHVNPPRTIRTSVAIKLGEQ